MWTGDFATAISCIDGRIQAPVADWLKINYHVRYVDTITEPGPDKVLAQGPPESVAAIRRKVAFSVGRAGHAGVLAILAHHDCLGNPVAKEEHLALVERGARVVASWGLPVRIVGLWVNEWWWVDLVCELDPPHAPR